jgi:hypothetical protein
MTDVRARTAEGMCGARPGRTPATRLRGVGAGARYASGDQTPGPDSGPRIDPAPGHARAPLITTGTCPRVRVDVTGISRCSPRCCPGIVRLGLCCRRRCDGFGGLYARVHAREGGSDPGCAPTRQLSGPAEGGTGTVPRSAAGQLVRTVLRPKCPDGHGIFWAARRRESAHGALSPAQIGAVRANFPGLCHALCQVARTVPTSRGQDSTCPDGSAAGLSGRSWPLLGRSTSRAGA